MRISSLSFALLLSAPFVLPACGGDDTGSTSNGGTGGTTASGGSTDTGGGGATGGTGGAEFVMQPHPPFPTLQGSQNAVIKKPRLVTVTFQDNPDADKIEAAGDAVVASKWFTDVGADYGITSATHLAKFRIPQNEPSSMTESDVLTLLDEQMQAGNLVKPEGDIAYLIYTAKGTNFSDDFGYQMCTEYLGYHWQANIPSGNITFGFVGDCNIGFEEVTATLAHELIEIASDPGFTGGYVFNPLSSSHWFPLAGMENADMCDYADYVTEGGYTWQRVWSNSAAEAAVGSPCAPVDPNEAYYNVYAEPDTIPKVSAGQSATFTLTGWSNKPVADWTITYDSEFYGNFSPKVELLDNKMNNGKSVTVTLTVPPGTPKNRVGTAMIYSGDGYGRFWPVSVRSQ